MKEKAKWLEKYAPLGMDVHTELIGYIVSVIVATLLSMIAFFVRYLAARSELYESYAGKIVLIEGAIIKDFASLTKGVFILIVIICVTTLLRAGYYYMYHYQGSIMMYLMKRLPDKWELHRRCLTLPIAGAVIMAVWSLVLRMIYFAIYMLCTPSQCLPL